MIYRAYGQEVEEPDVEVVFDPPPNMDREEVAGGIAGGLVPGRRYTVTHTFAGSSWTTYSLAGLPGEFNAALFSKVAA